MPKGRTLRSEVQEAKRSDAGDPTRGKAPLGRGARGWNAPAKPRGARGLTALPEDTSALPRMAFPQSYFYFHLIRPFKFTPVQKTLSIKKSRGRQRLPRVPANARNTGNIPCAKYFQTRKLLHVESLTRMQ